VVQYRLGLLGFLSSGDSRCPGNFGLWDQLAAFQWVKVDFEFKNYWKKLISSENN
jgi:carboxylesterase type B